MSLCMLLMMALLFAGLIGKICFNHFHPDSNSNPSAGGFLLLPSVACFLGAMWFEIHLPRKLGLLCPNCDRSLASKMGRTALLTGNCGHCGKAVFDTSRRRPGSARRFSRPEFIASVKALNRKITRRMAGMLLGAAAVVIGCVPLIKYLNDLIDQGRFDDFYPTWAVWTALFVIGMLFLGFMTVFYCAARGKLKMEGVPCPECHKPLHGPTAQVAATTGECVFCGEQIVDLT
jgi:hypothetical protein